MQILKYTKRNKFWQPYLINTIEMRSLWMETKYIKSTSRLLDRNYVNKGGLDLSKEVLCTCGQSGFEPGQSAELFFWPPTLTARRSAALQPTKTCSTSLERSKPFLLTQSLFKTLAVILTYLISVQSDLISIELMY